MNSLEGFLKENKIVKENLFYPASDSFLDANGKPLEWEIRAITSSENKEIRNSCIKQRQVKGRKGQFVKDFDDSLYLSKLIAASVVFPDLANAKLQDSYGVKSEIELLDAMLNPGELFKLSTQVQEYQGFGEDEEELVEEVKNE